MGKIVKVCSFFGTPNPEELEALLYGVSLSFGRQRLDGSRGSWQRLADELSREPQYLSVVVPSGNEVKTYLHCDAVVSMVVVPNLRRLSGGEVWWGASLSQQLADRGARLYALAYGREVVEL